MAQKAVERKQKLEEEHFEAQFGAQLTAAKRELHFKRLKDEQDNARRAAREAKNVAQQEAAAKRRAKVGARPVFVQLMRAALRVMRRDATGTCLWASWIMLQVQRLKEEAEEERIEYNKVKAANAQAKADEELAKKVRREEEHQLSVISKRKPTVDIPCLSQ